MARSVRLDITIDRFHERACPHCGQWSEFVDRSFLCGCQEGLEDALLNLLDVTSYDEEDYED